jgi:hypothetical protein
VRELHSALKKGESGGYTVIALLKAGVDPGAESKKGKTALHKALKYCPLAV